MTVYGPAAKEGVTPVTIPYVADGLEDAERDCLVQRD